jgi:hypothetical protein
MNVPTLSQKLALMRKVRGTTTKEASGKVGGEGGRPGSNGSEQEGNSRADETYLYLVEDWVRPARER